MEQIRSPGCTIRLEIRQDIIYGPAGGVQYGLGLSHPGGYDTISQSGPCCGIYHKRIHCICPDGFVGSYDVHPRVILLVGLVGAYGIAYCKLDVGLGYVGRIVPGPEYQAIIQYKPRALGLFLACYRFRMRVADPHAGLAARYIQYLLYREYLNNGIPVVGVIYQVRVYTLCHRGSGMRVDDKAVRGDRLLRDGVNSSKGDITAQVVVCQHVGIRQTLHSGV